MDLINKYSQTLFNKIRNRFSNISMIDDKGASTLSDREARIFNMLFIKQDPETMVTLSIMEPAELKIYFNRNMIKKFNEYNKQQWFEFLGELRRFTVNRQLGYDLLDLEKSGLSKRDITAMIKSNKDKVTESRFSRLSGSRRTSYQVLERHKIKVLHGKVINDDIHGSRSRNIKALFIENNLGECYKFPFVNLNGVRAMARHMEEGGNWSDQLGHHIIEMTNNLCTIKSFVREVRKQKMVNENMLPVLQQLREKQLSYKRDLYLLSGSKGYHSYKQNLSETYVEPVSSIASHFTSINPAIEQYLPSIEKILGEKQSNSILDEVVAEQVNWIKSITRQIFEAPVTPAPAVDATKNATPANNAAGSKNLTLPPGLLSILKPPSGVPGKKMELTPNVLNALGLTNPQAAWLKMPNAQKEKLVAAAIKGAMPMPVVIYYADSKQYAVDDADKDILILLAANFPKVQVWVVDPKFAGKLKNAIGKFASGFTSGQGKTAAFLNALQNPGGAMGIPTK